MDPDEALSDIMWYARAILKDYDDEVGGGVSPEDAESLAQAVIDLHGWLKSGGFPPKCWDMQAKLEVVTNE